MLILSFLWMLAAATPGDRPRGPAPADTVVAWAATDSLPMRLALESTLAESGDARGQVIEPAGVAVDAFGRTYVSDGALHRLQWFDRDGKLGGETGTLGSDAGQMRRPGSVAVLGATGVAVLDRENRRVLTYDLFGRRAGTAIDLADPTLETELGRVDPSGLAADRGGALYVIDAARERILTFDFSGRFVRALGGYGSGPSAFRGLRAVAAAPRGELMTAEITGQRVQRLDVGGRMLVSWNLPGPRSKKTPSQGGLAIAVDDSGRVAVADEPAGRVWVFARDGAPLAALAGLGRPRALAFAPDGRLVVAETAPGRVRRFALTRTTSSGTGR